MKTHSLTGEWLLSDEHDEYRLNMLLPGDVISALQVAGAIPDPYVGRNEYGLRWISERDWVLSREFELCAQSLAAGWELCLSELDTVAEVYVNDHCVLNAQNQFRRYRCDLSAVLQPGSNRIRIRLLSVVRQAALRQAAQPWPVPWHQGNCPIPHGNMLRKVQCDFGWDWNIALAPVGLYGNCHLEPRRTARISALSIDTSMNQDLTEGQVVIRATIGQGCLRLDFDGREYEAHAGPDGIAHCTLLIDRPSLWWPAGLGEQHLYTLTVQSADDRQTRRIGFRRMQLITQSAEDADDAPFYLCINDRPVFCRGANWIPADALPGRISVESTRALLQSSVDANMNMLRVWGGGRYEPDSFYDACDELGLLVWQDFMFSCNLYPSTPDFLDEVSLEVADVAERLHHHACLALWCGDNELVGALNWFPESIANRDRYLVAYDRLNRSIESTLKATCPTANWWPSSPCSGYMNYGDAWHDDSSGDMHFWSVWHEGRNFEHYRDVKPRFCSEFGFQSYPSMSLIRGFADAEDFNIASPVLESHQKNAGGNARIAETMFRYFRFPVGFGNFVYLSQVQQGLAIRTAVDYWRSLKPHCMGALYWQLNDTWPVASWSSLDYGNNWKLLHYMAKRFFAPVRASLYPQVDTLELRLVNDTLHECLVDYEIAAVDMSGTWRDLAAGVCSVATDRALAAAAVPASSLQENEIIAWRWRRPGDPWQQEHHATRPYKTLALRDPGLSFRCVESPDGWTLHVDSAALALYVAVESDRPGRFSDNAVMVLPGHPWIIDFTPQSAGEGVAPCFVLRDLYSAGHVPG